MRDNTHDAHDTPSPDLYRALRRVTCFANGKGGVGKTSAVANVAGLAAAGGWRTLIIDLDPQATLGTDLGYAGGGLGDEGETLVNALMSGQPLSPDLPGIRDNLDAISGGEVLDDLEDVLAGRSRRSQDTRLVLAQSLAPIAGNYDLVLIDTPPTRPTLIQLALAASRWVVVPTRTDRGSIRGLQQLANQMVRVRDINPDLELLGALLFGSGTTASRVRVNAQEDVSSALGEVAPLFSAVIRHSEAVAAETRERGLLAHELAAHMSDIEPHWKALKEGRTPERAVTAVSSVAGDYLALTQEVLGRITAAENTKEETA